MRRRTVAAITVAATGSLVAGGVAFSQGMPGSRSSMPMSMGGMMGMMGLGQPMPGRMGMMAGGQRMPVVGQHTDQWFIREMVPHHEDAVVMADLALGQTEHSELRNLAQQIRATQSQEISQMRAWYQGWFGTPVPPSVMDQMHASMAPMMGSMMGPMHADPTSIDGAKPFDKAFIEQMIPHHQMAVMMATHALAGAEHPELETLLQSIITGQSGEIREMQAWYRAWYGTQP